MTLKAVKQLREYFFPDFGNVQRDLDNLGKELAIEFYYLLVDNIRTNKYGFELAKSTINKRLRRGNEDETPLLDTGSYLDQISINGAKIEVSNGVHYSGLTYQELSFILEHGRRDKRIPAFPVWKLTYEEFKPYADERIDKLMKKRLSRKLF